MSGRCQQVIDRVVVRSRSQIVKQYALFVVFLGIEWAHDIVIGRFSHFGGTKNGTSGARIQILRSLL